MLIIHNLCSQEEIWLFLKGPILENIYEDEFVMMTNKMIGSVRLRQVRVASTPCNYTTSHTFDAVPTCFPEYSLANEDTQPFGPGCPDGNACGYVAHANMLHTGMLFHRFSSHHRSVLPTEKLTAKDFIRRGAKVAFVMVAQAIMWIFLVGKTMRMK